MELGMCRKDLEFNAILNHTDWGTFNKPKYDLSYMFFDTISSFRMIDRWFIICPKHMYRFDLVFCTSKEKMHQFQSKTVATTMVDSGNGVFQTSLGFDKTQALLNLSMHFSKISYHKVYLGRT